MPEQKIHYAVIALTKDEASQVVKKLENENKPNLVNWLKNNKDRVYGTIPDHWKPFYDKKIEDIINNHDYFSDSLKVSNLDDQFQNKEELRSIQVYFIDVFAMFLDKYKRLANLLDFGLAPAKECRCCFLIYYGLPKDIQDELAKEYSSAWPSVSKAYKKGSLHRIAVRVDDLRNFRNYLVNLSKQRERPNYILVQAAEQDWGEPRTNPVFESR
ncbi:MAG: hypothetical protein JSW07_04330 [bacterium]|nr:MAG: hypothetical protein JSW07_04330 [bacterium]